MRERQVSMLYHMLYLSLHSYAEKCDKVHHENRPEDRDIENIEERAAEGDRC